MRSLDKGFVPLYLKSDLNLSARPFVILYVVDGSMIEAVGRDKVKLKVRVTNKVWMIDLYVPMIKKNLFSMTSKTEMKTVGSLPVLQCVA